MNNEIKELLEKYEGNLFGLCKDFLEKDAMIEQLAEKLGEYKKENKELIIELESEENEKPKKPTKPSKKSAE